MFDTFESMPLDRLEDEIATLAAHEAAGKARFLLAVAAFADRDGWARAGIKSLAHWLSWRCGLSAVAARDHARVAAALPALPAITAAFASGELSYSKVRAITRIATAATDEMLTEWARHGTTAQLETLVRHVRGVVGSRDPMRARRARALETSYQDGMLVVTVRVPPEDGAVLIKAIESATKLLETDEPVGSQSRDVSAESPEHPEDGLDAEDPYDFDAAPLPARRRADALRLIAESFLATGPVEAPPDRRALIVVHTDLESLQGRGERAELPGGEPISIATLRRLACDANVVSVVDAAGGIPMSIGRRHRQPPRRIRRALRRRDKGCRFPACTATRCDAHHIIFWADGGETSLENLILLCPRHHRFIHEAGFAIRTHGKGTVTFHRPDGTQIVARPVRIPAGCDALVAANRDRGLTITPSTAATWDGRHPDYPLAVGVYFQEQALSDAARAP